MAETFASRTLRELARVVLSRWLTIVVVVVAAAGGTYYACRVAPKYYRCQVTLQVKQPPRSPVVREVSPDRSLQVFVRTQQQIVLSSVVLSRAMAEVDLRLRGQPVMDEAVDAAAEQIVKQRQEDLRRFRKKVQVKTPSDGGAGMSEVIIIQVDQADPPGVTPGKTAYLTALALQRQYVRRFSELQQLASKQAAELVRKRLEDLKETLLKPAEQAMRDFLERDLINPADIVVLEQLEKSGAEAGGQVVRTAFEKELIRLSGLIAEDQGLLRELVAQLPEGLVEIQQSDKPPVQTVVLHYDKLEQMSDEQVARCRIIVPETILKNNDIINKLKKKLADLIIARNRLQIQFTPEYRGLRDVIQEIAKTQRQIISEMMAEARAISIRIRTMQDRYQQIKKLVEQQTEELDRISELYVRYQSLKHQLLLARQQYSYLQRQLIDVGLAEEQARKATTVIPLDEPVMPDPTKPVYPKIGLYTGTAAVAGLLLALALAFVADYFDHTLRTTGEAQRYLGVPVLASIRQVRGGMIRLVKR